MQTDYDNLAPAVKGGIADSGFTDIVSSQSAEVIQFGRGVVILANGNCALPSLLTDGLDAVALQKHSSVPNASPNEAQYDIGDDISLLKKGRVWVYSEQPVDPTKPVYMRVTDNGVDDEYEGLSPGNFRTDVDLESVDTAVEVTNARWGNVTTEAGLAILELNMP